MPRKPGDRNRDFEQKRSTILDRLEERLLRPDGARVTLNEMATVADVSVSSLRHHVGGRPEVWAAMLARYGAKGAPFLKLAAAPTDEPLGPSLHRLLELIALGLGGPLLEILAAGLAAGLREPTVGPAYLDALLEPILQSVEARLGHHVDRGELPPCDLRMAALQLVSPLVLAALHQQGLGGCAVRPLDLDTLVDEQARRFVAAYAPA
jgi:AcrR family transcriptional regulator